MDFKDRLKEARESAGLSQGDLADKIGVTRQAITHLETGYAKAMKTDHLFECARVLQVNPEWLGRGTGSPRTGFYTLPASDEAQVLALQIDRLEPENRRVLMEMIRQLEGRAGRNRPR